MNCESSESAGRQAFGRRRRRMASNNKLRRGKSRKEKEIVKWWSPVENTRGLVV